MTAAHCVQNKGDYTPKKAEEATSFLGKHDLHNWMESNFMQSGVVKFAIHSEWNPNDSKFDADIAIAVLLRTIDFNKFVQSICLWTFTEGYEDIVGKEGFVAGWGKTEATNCKFYNQSVYI